MKFTLEINLGNDAMRTNCHLRMALQKVIDRLYENNYPMDEEVDRGVMDGHGNTVGSWHLKKDT